MSDDYLICMSKAHATNNMVKAAQAKQETPLYLEGSLLGLIVGCSTQQLLSIL